MALLQWLFCKQDLFDCDVICFTSIKQNVNNINHISAKAFWLTLTSKYTVPGVLKFCRNYVLFLHSGFHNLIHITQIYKFHISSDFPNIVNFVVKREIDFICVSVRCKNVSEAQKMLSMFIHIHKWSLLVYATSSHTSSEIVKWKPVLAPILECAI